MSAISTDPLDIAERVVRIRRMQEEADTFAAEQRKLIEEAPSSTVTGWSPQ